MPSLPVIITCTQPRADAIVGDLTAKGISARACTALGISATNVPCPQGNFDLILLSSGNAVTFGHDMPRLPVICVGDTTAATAVAHGLDCIYTGQGTLADTMDSPALHTAKHILYPCGVHRSHDTDNLLSTLHAQVTYWPVYETAFDGDLSHDLPDGECLIVLFSIRGAQSFAQVCRVHPSVQSFSVLCLSTQIADVIGEIPLKNLAVCPRPDYACLSEMIVDLAKTEGQNNGNLRTSERNR